MASQIPLRRFVGFALRFKFRFAAIMAACLLLAVVAIMLSPTRYRAEGQMLVKMGRELIARSEVSSTQQIQPVIDVDRILASNVEIISGREVLWDAMRRVGPYRIFPDLAPDAPVSPVRALVLSVKEALGRGREDASDSDGSATMVRALRRQLSIGTIKQTNVITVSFDHESPDVAAEVVNAVLDVFSAKASAVFSQGNAELISAQLVDDQRRLTDAENALISFRTQSGLFNAPDQTLRLLARQQELTSALQAVDTRVAELTQRVTTLTAQVARTPQTIELFEESDRYKVIDDTNAQLLQLRLRERDMSTHFQDSHPPLRALRRQIVTAEGFLRDQQRVVRERTKTGVNETWRVLNIAKLQAETDLSSETARRATIAAQVTGLAEELNAMTTAQRELGMMERGLRIGEATVQQTAQRLDAARALDDLNSGRSGSFTVVQPAIANDGADPVQPRPMIYLTLAFVLGCVLTCGVAMLTFLSQDTYSEPEQVEDELDVPNLAVVNLRRTA